MILEYTEKVSEQIPKVLKKVLGVGAKSLIKLAGGEVTYVFKVETNKEPLAVRIFRYDSIPWESTLRLVDEKLNELKIRHPKIIHFDRSNKYFKHGFMISEWIEGLGGWEAIGKRLVTEEEIAEKVAKILKKIHTVKFNRFGHPPFNKKNKGYKDFNSFILNFDKENRLDKMVKEKLISGQLVKIGKELLESLLERNKYIIEPVMVHSDATPENVIWTKKGLVLIDWDGVRATNWTYDLAWITYWQGIKLKKPLFKGYRPGQGKIEEFDFLENLFHLRLSLELLPYYAYDLQNKERIKKGVAKLKELNVKLS